MKLKFICHPQQSIWLKKLISKSLVIGLLFNTTLSSFAGILSEDERYETFEGNNITIDNILEEDKVDIEIEGNTLVNLSHIRNYQCGPASHNYNHKLKPNTTYTFITDVSNVKGNPECVLMRITYKDGTFQSISDKIHTSNEKIIIKFTTQNKDINRYYFGWIRNYVENETLLTMNDTMLLEGDWTNKEIPEYFEGMKSVGELEDNKIEIKSQNKNLFNIHKVYSEGYGGRKDEAYIEVVNNSLFISKKTIPGNMVGLNIKCQKGKTYTLGFIGGINSNGTPNSIYVYEDKFWGKELFKLDNDSSTESASKTFVATSDEIFVGCYLSGQTGIGEVLEYKNIFVIEGENCEYIQYKDDLLQYTLNEPLKGLPNGVKDRIVKRNGQWMIERNLTEIKLNGDDKLNYSLTGSNSDILNVRGNIINAKGNSKSISDKLLVSTVPLYSDTDTSTLSTSYYTGYIDNQLIRIFIKGINTLEEYKNYLRDNPITIIYELANSIYEPLDIEPTINLYSDITYISNSSTIPANMKITVDRTINRATEAIELAKSNPTVENISKARMWSNLLKESIKKDELQNEINNITNIEGLEIERKTATSNMDVYIKSQNSLSMSLSTNSIVFDDFSGVEDLEKLKAIEITISSSLPYQLNSCLESEIKNSDGSKIIPKELLNIRLNGEVDYKAFSNINDKLVLKETCESGNDDIFKIDLILKGSLTHKTDMYKTVIKFEAEQK